MSIRAAQERYHERRGTQGGPVMTEETPANPLAEIRAAHVLCTHSSLRPGGINLNKAGCSCGARYDWEHAEHVDAAIVARMADIWDEAYQHGYEDDGAPNPYRAEERA